MTPDPVQLMGDRLHVTCWASARWIPDRSGFDAVRGPALRVALKKRLCRRRPAEASGRIFLMSGKKPMSKAVGSSITESGCRRGGGSLLLEIMRRRGAMRMSLHCGERLPAVRSRRRRKRSRS
jgi:hypothetical protein